RQGMKVLLIQLDGKIPNIALMRIAAHHTSLGDEVELRRASSIGAGERGVFDPPGQGYASLLFERTRPLAERLKQVYPAAIIGGTGWDVGLRLEDIGITTTAQDYSVYPGWRQSIGFTQRGCRYRCPFCTVPRKEGSVREEQSVWYLWRGGP